MKKVLCLTICLLMLLLTSTASAEKIKFKDKNFNYKNFQTVQMGGMNFLAIDRTDFEEDQAADSKLLTSLRTAFSNRNINLVTTEEMKGGEATTLISKPFIQAKIFIMGFDKIWHEAWIETVYTTRDLRIKDKDGKETTISIPDKEYVNHPAGYYYTARVDIEFNVKDSRTDKVIYTVRDTRSRGGETDTSGMLKRICNDFAEDLTHNA